MRLRRWAACGFGLVIMGAATTLLLGWWLSYRAEGQLWVRNRFYFIGWKEAGDKGAAVVSERHWFGITYLRVHRRSPERFMSSELRPAAEVAPHWAAKRLESVSRALPKIDENGPGYMVRLGNRTNTLLVGVGWPWTSFVCTAKTQPALELSAFEDDCQWEGPGVQSVEWGGLSIDRGMRAADEGFSVFQPDGLRVPLPVIPCWTGFAGDTLLFTGMWAGVAGILVAAARGRAWMRERRGRCRGCGYDLRGLPAEACCSECGAGRGRVRGAECTTAR